jgi:DNA-binding GntR family transcriptional regulator
VSQVGECHHDQARVYNELKAMVMAYRFRPGEQLLIGELADRLGVSSTPIREALIRLQAESLLAPMYRRGFFARALSAKEMIDLYACGTLILKQALVDSRSVIDGRTLEDFYAGVLATVQALTTNGTETLAPARVQQCAEHLERTYQAIASFSKNDVMLSTIRNISDRTHYVRLIDLEAPQRFNSCLRTVADVVSALQSRDIGNAIATLDSDFKRQIECMPAIIREGVSRAYGLGPLLDPVATSGVADVNSGLP